MEKEQRKATEESKAKLLEVTQDQYLQNYCKDKIEIEKILTGEYVNLNNLININLDYNDLSLTNDKLELQKSIHNKYSLKSKPDFEKNISAHIQPINKD